jgi:hypothetical protein
MLRRILTIIVIIGLAVTFGCKKKESQPVAPSMSDMQKQVEETSKDVAEEAEVVKEQAAE